MRLQTTPSTHSRTQTVLPPLPPTFRAAQNESESERAQISLHTSLAKITKLTPVPLYNNYRPPVIKAIHAGNNGRSKQRRQPPVESRVTTPPKDVCTLPSSRCILSRSHPQRSHITSDRPPKEPSPSVLSLSSRAHTDTAVVGRVHAGQPHRARLAVIYLHRVHEGHVGCLGQQAAFLPRPLFESTTQSQTKSVRHRQQQ